MWHNLEDREPQRNRCRIALPSPMYSFTVHSSSQRTSTPFHIVVSRIIGKGGRYPVPSSRPFWTHTSRRPRRHGNANKIYRHCRQVRTRVCHCRLQASSPNSRSSQSSHVDKPRLDDSAVMRKLLHINIHLALPGAGFFAS